MPYYGYYFDWTYFLILIGAIISAVASSKVKSTYAKYGRVGSHRGMTATQAARMILDNAGLRHVRIERIAGDLTDHYSPNELVLRLSDTTINSTSIAAIGVAAHECGHAIQHAEHYAPLKIRNAIVPVVNIGSKLSWPMILIGLLLGFTGFLDLGILLFSFSLIFQLITLPVEFNASSRALQILEYSNMLYDEELRGAKKVLSAAAMTYVAAAIATLLSLLRLIILFGGRRRDD
ncbi:MAG: zinc metallopeptidase [Lachnospiraceae bacterium]|nr:zinc metallopeptidase [Lachnospiraceae bacterium]